MNVSQLKSLASDWMAGKPAKVRSPKWPAVRKAAIDASPFCQVCGNKNRKALVGHHRKPFHLHPELELEPSNVAVVCEDGPGHLNCHLVVGHTGDFKQVNERFDEDAAYIGSMLRRE